MVRHAIMEISHLPQGSLITCECGCGSSWPASSMVHRKSSNEDLYIPHAIDSWGIFCDPIKLREKLDSSGIFTHFYALPGEAIRDWIELMQGTFQFSHYTRFFDLKWGAYYVWEVNHSSETDWTFKV